MIHELSMNERGTPWKPANPSQRFRSNAALMNLLSDSMACRSFIFLSTSLPKSNSRSHEKSMKRGTQIRLSLICRCFFFELSGLVQVQNSDRAASVHSFTRSGDYLSASSVRSVPPNQEMLDRSTGGRYFVPRQDRQGTPTLLNSVTNKARWMMLRSAPKTTQWTALNPTISHQNSRKIVQDPFDSSKTL